MITRISSTTVVLTAFDRPILPTAPKCVTVVGDFRKKYDENMNSVYVKVGDIDVNEYIGSFEKGCSLKDILQRCSLMPTEAKIRALQQKADGVSADLTNMPKDGSEAVMLLNKIKVQHPDIVERFSNGESFDSIIKALVSESSPASSDTTTTATEVIDNGSN